jgi:prevent-host-death family protein
MKNTVTATELARNVADILARVRYRGESFVVERNGRPIARIVPAGPPPASLADALSAWLSGRESDPGFADDLASVDAADRPPDNPWDS